MARGVASAVAAVQITPVNHLLVFGLGYSGRAIAQAAAVAGWRVTATARSRPESVPAGVAVIGFDAAGPALADATHVVSTVPPDADGDPVLRRWRLDPAGPRWAGYLSTTGVYGDHGGAWVTEDTPPRPATARARRRVAAEAAWSALGARMPVDLFRTSGIYGPGRSALDAVRDGSARRIARPGHRFNRIHRDDIARAALAAAGQAREAGVRVLHLSDDEPAESAAVMEEAARLLGAPLPLLVPFEQARARMGEMAREFWSESRRVSSRATRAALGIAWTYPTYREGLRAILSAEQTVPGSEKSPADQVRPDQLT